MSESVRGSIEILIGDPATDSIGMTVEAATAESVPVIVAAVHGLTDITSVEPEPHAGRMPEAQWSAMRDVDSATVLLWREAEAVDG